MEKVAQQHARNFFFCIWEKQPGFIASGSPYKASQMPMAAVDSVGTQKRWVPTTLTFSESEIHAEHREQQTLAVTEVNGKGHSVVSEWHVIFVFV